MPPPAMGPSSASASFSYLRPSSLSSSSPNSLSDWFLTSSDRDTQILTQALTRELSTPASSCLSSSSSLCQTLSSSLGERSDPSESLHVLRALQQQQKQQHQQHAKAALAAMSYGGWPRQDAGFHSSLQIGSPPSSNSHSPLSASNPGSPYSNSTIATTSSSMTMPSDSLLAYMKPNISSVQEGVFANTMVSHDASPSDNLQSSSIALSAQASVGVGGNKVSKKRSRASNRTPVAVLSADVSNFRAMVQQLTGIPSTAAMHSYGGGSSTLKPYSTKQTYTDAALSLPTLDTSAAFIGSKLPLQGFSFAQRHGYRSSGALAQGGGDAASMRRSDAPLQAGAVFGEQACVSSSSSTLASLWNHHASNGNPRGNSLSVIDSSKNPLEQHLPTKSQYSAVDSWITFDGVLANQTPNIEIARMA